MKKNILNIVLMLFTVNVFAQKVKVKDGVITIDGVAAAKIQTISKKEKHSEYKISSLSDSSLIQVKEFMIDKDAWYALVFSDGRRGDMKFDLMSFTLSMEKAIAELLVKKHKLITPSGLDTTIINDFVTKSNAERRSVVEKANAEIDKRQKVEEMRLWVESDGRVTSRGRVIGYAEAPDNVTTVQIRGIKFYDVNKNLIVEGDIDGIWHQAFFKTPAGVSVPIYVSPPSVATERLLFLTNLASQLASLGYY